MSPPFRQIIDRYFFSRTVRRRGRLAAVALRSNVFTDNVFRCRCNDRTQVAWHFRPPEQTAIAEIVEYLFRECAYKLILGVAATFIDT